MADILLDTQSQPATPAAGQIVLYADSVSKRLTTKNDAGLVDTLDDNTNFSTANQTGFAADTYLAGSSILIPRGGVRAGSMYYLRFDMVKTAAGTAAAVLTIRYGTAGSVADAARLTFTFGAGTAAIDTGFFEIWAHWRNAGASSVLVGVASCSHALAATGLISTGASGVGILNATSSAFDSAPTDSIIGASFNGGASFAGTNVLVQSEAVNL